MGRPRQGFSKVRPSTTTPALAIQSRLNATLAPDPGPRHHAAHHVTFPGKWPWLKTRGRPAAVPGTGRPLPHHPPSREHEGKTPSAADDSISTKRRGLDLTRAAARPPWRPTPASNNPNRRFSYKKALSTS